MYVLTTFTNLSLYVFLNMENPFKTNFVELLIPDKEKLFFPPKTTNLTVLGILNHIPKSRP